MSSASGELELSAVIFSVLASTEKQEMSLNVNELTFLDLHFLLIHFVEIPEVLNFWHFSK
jgi:hypothetical protein